MTAKEPATGIRHSSTVLRAQPNRQPSTVMTADPKRSSTLSGSTSTKGARAGTNTSPASKRSATKYAASRPTVPKLFPMPLQGMTATESGFISALHLVPGFGFDQRQILLRTHRVCSPVSARIGVRGNLRQPAFPVRIVIDRLRFGIQQIVDGHQRSLQRRGDG